MTSNEAKLNFIDLIGIDGEHYVMKIAGEIIDKIYADLGSCKTCNWLDEKKQCRMFNIEENKLPGFCGKYSNATKD